MPASRAARTTSWRASSRSRPRTSRTCQVPRPTAETSTPLRPSLRCCTSVDLPFRRREGFFGAVLEGGDGGEEPFGAGAYLFGLGVVEDLGARAFGDGAPA